MKSKRIVDEELLSVVRGLPCIACRQTPVHAHHVTSRGAGGHDTAENLMPLCVQHHAEWHQGGPGKMVRTYPSVRYWLEAAERWDVLERIRK